MLLLVSCNTKWLLLLYDSFEWIFFEDSSHCLWEDLTKNDGIDIMSSLDSIESSAYGDLSDDSMLSNGWKLRETARKGYRAVETEISEYPSDNRLADT